MKSLLNTSVLVVATIVLMAVCSDPVPAPSETSREIRSKGTSPSPSTQGVLEGQVLFEGPNIPRSTQVENTTDPQHCGRTQSLGDIIISTENQGIKNVIVTLNGVPLPKDYQPQTSTLLLDNRSCQFQPHVAVLTTGSSIEAINSDPIFHSVHFYGFLNRNLALGPNQSKIVRTVSRPGYYIVKCDVHGWMQAFFRVDNHPFHAVSTADGTFRIENIPPGSYTLEAWHEYFGHQEITVSMATHRPSRVTIYYRDQGKGGA
ncbi:carboxypeptidase regulatory-like domain-containing protein [Acidobacteria bacterium AH-259-D05]|nr:carboxypeptidase regulatory-like domain-containing protein [Acidobacteria bacterium AH-259-D05]